MSAFSSNNWRQPAPPGADRDAPRQGDDSASGVDASISEGRRIYMGNLDYMLRPDDVESFLGSTGSFQPAKVHMTADDSSGRNPGYCFVEFGTKEEADRALEVLPGAELSGRNVKVGPCTPKRQDGQNRYRVGGQDRERPSWQEGGWNRQGSGYGRAGPRGEGSNGYESGSRQWQPRQPRGGEGEGNGGSRWGSGQRNFENDDSYLKTLYIGSLPRQEDTAEIEAGLQDLFKDYAVESISKPRAPNATFDDSPVNNYFCFVKFASEDDASQAMGALNGVSFQGAQLRISAARPPNRQRGPRTYGDRDSRDRA